MSLLSRTSRPAHSIHYAKLANIALTSLSMFAILTFAGTASAQVTTSFDTTGYPERIALEAALTDADSNDDNIQEISVQTGGDWLVITDNTFQHSANFQFAARFVAEARWSTYNETIDAVAVAPDNSYVVVANGTRYSSLTPAQNPDLLEALIDYYISENGSIDELVFDSDGVGWVVSSNGLSFSFEMPDEFQDAWWDTYETDRPIRAASTNGAGEWVLHAANWFASDGASQPFRYELAVQNRLGRSIDHVHYNAVGGYLIGSNGDYVYGSGVLDQLEENVRPAGSGSITVIQPLWSALLYDNIIGASIAYYQNGELVERRGYGLKRDFPNRYKGENWVGVDTRFEFASVSKTVAAATTLAVISDPAQSLTLETTVDSVGGSTTALQRWIDEGEQLYNTTFPSTMKVKHLLSHTSGLEGRGSTIAGKDWGGVQHFAWDDNKPGPFQLLMGTDDDDCDTASCALPGNADDILWCGTNTNGLVSPGEAFHYSGGGYTALEAVLAAQTGNLFPGAANYRIFSPLGMTRSTYLSPSDEWGAGDTMMQHEVGPSGVVAKSNPGVMFHHAAASLMSTPTDVGRVGVMIDAGGLPDAFSPETDRIIDASLMTQMLTPAVLDNGNSVTYGLGLSMKKRSSCLNGDGTAKIVWHTGVNESARALLAINRDTSEVIVISFAAADEVSADTFQTRLYARVLEVLGWDTTCVL